MKRSANLQTIAYAIGRSTDETRSRIADVRLWHTTDTTDGYSLFLSINITSIYLLVEERSDSLKDLAQSSE
jgi:hypothetical protein